VETAKQTRSPGTNAAATLLQDRLGGRREDLLALALAVPRAPTTTDP
jgi:hypothetical protein